MKTRCGRGMMTAVAALALLASVMAARAAEFETRVAGNWHADADNTPGVGTWDVVSGAPVNTYPISGDTALFKHRVDVTADNPQVFSGGSLGGDQPGLATV